VTHSVTIERDRGRQVSGVYIKTPTEPGQLIEGTLLTRKDKDLPGTAWVLSADATIYPVALASLGRIGWCEKHCTAHASGTAC
jgi:hypothetical protein